MPYKVLLTHDAVNDLEELDTWISTNDSPEKAEYVLDKIGEVFKRLSELPERGTYPKELSMLGIHDFREVFFKPYRIIYRVERSIVYVYLITDGRRDMQTLLSRRLLNA
jgi:toxin ParE1/3/4